MLFTHARNKELRNELAKMEKISFAEMTYNGKPLPAWLREPAFDSQFIEDKEEKLPEWLQEPVKFS